MRSNDPKRIPCRTRNAKLPGLGCRIVSPAYMQIGFDGLHARSIVRATPESLDDAMYEAPSRLTP